MSGPLEHRRVLLVEDETFVLMMIEDMLLDLGAETVKTASRLEEGKRVAEEADVDLAVLDVNLGGQMSYPIAEVLQARGIPFLFSTGYGTQGHAIRWKGVPTLQKPYAAQDLARAVRGVLN